MKQPTGTAIKRRHSRTQGRDTLRDFSERRPKKNRGTAQAGNLDAEMAREREVRLRDIELGVRNGAPHRTSREKTELLLRYSGLFEKAPVALFSLNENGTIVEVNAAGAELLGMKKHLLLRRRLDSFVSIDSKDTFSSYFKGLFERGGRQACEINLLKTRETQLPVHIVGSTAELRRDSIELLLSAIDVSRRRQAEEDIRSQNSNLERLLAERTSELEAFSYSISHDLREPLRQIEGFSRALADDFPECLNSAARDFLTRMSSATAKISWLINGLARFSRLSAWQIKIEDTDLSEIAKSIAEVLRRSAPERRVDFIIAEGIRARCDAEMLKVVLETLLGNSWKLTEHRQSGNIEFGVTTLKGAAVYYVRDDGAGFDMAYSEKLFMPFHQIHQHSPFPGRGIGLATAKQIIIRHGGRIWAEGAVEKGATFYFTLSETTGK